MKEIDTIVCGDCLDVMGRMDDNVIDTIITDPPYGIAFMQAGWDHGIPGVRYWREALRVAKPGAFLLAFGGTRTWHRLAVAIEDAGWEIRDTMMWLYGQGFPKSHNISKAIDKAAGAERKVVGSKLGSPGYSLTDNGRTNDVYGDLHNPGKECAVEAPATEAAAQWDGWGSGIKPAFEPVIVAMKPLDGTFAQNALRWNCAGLWIDGARVGVNGKDANFRGNRGLGRSAGGWYGEGEAYNKRDEDKVTEYQQYSGRWPSNVCLLHAEGCKRVGTRRVQNESGKASGPTSSVKVGYTTIGDFTGERGEVPYYADPDGLETVEVWECVDGCPVKALGEQSGERPSAGYYKDPTGACQKRDGSGSTVYPGFDSGNKDGRRRTTPYSGDTGTAARFFYQAKSSRKERNQGCEDFYWKRDGKELVQVDRDEWETLDDRQRARGNIHPTVKPLGMLEYLCKLTRTPTGGVVFDPFIGSGTTAVAALKLGRHFYGCDINPEYVRLANARIEKTRLELAQIEMDI